ncbi:MAG: VOC family protein [Nitrosomonas sp.]|nr:MAG: VOC family protein [Nitrosomonas sp.]
MSQVSPIPEGMHTVTPHLVCSDAAKAIEFYRQAFNATEMIQVPGPGGKLIHACIRIGDSLVMLVDENPHWDCLSPLTLKGSPVTIHLQVEDVDAVFNQAVKAGATVTMPVDNMFWGDRYGSVRDPFGHQWSIATHIRDVSPEEIRQAAAVECTG